MIQMTKIEPDSIVVYEVSLNDHPLIARASDQRTNSELVEDVERRTHTADGIDWPDWRVFVNDDPGHEAIRYVQTASRINVRDRYGRREANQSERDVFDEIADRVDIDGFDIENAAMSHWSPTHEDDFDGPIHLDLTDE